MRWERTDLRCLASKQIMVALLPFTHCPKGDKEAFLPIPLLTSSASSKGKEERTSTTSSPYPQIRTQAQGSPRRKFKKEKARKKCEN
ncbi:unnamed protein product [Cuscuta europaea]|uniref:Uncharacterized protein n=1 Tax=Cuscuta europaea TaxID=41803 RepID=A0A9P1ENU0_CUSEU|nr:unnamed protein product [Cuscuta europaea]